MLPENAFVREYLGELIPVHQDFRQQLLKLEFLLRLRTKEEALEYAEQIPHSLEKVGLFQEFGMEEVAEKIDQRNRRGKSRI